MPNLKKDPSSKQLILLPSDDIFTEFDQDNISDSSGIHPVGSSKSIDSTEFAQNNLFVSDCLKTYRNKKYEIKYKYHSYGGNYRQLPGYNDSDVVSNEFSNGFKRFL